MTSFPNQSKVAPERLEFHLEGGFPRRLAAGLSLSPSTQARWRHFPGCPLESNSHRDDLQPSQKTLQVFNGDMLDELFLVVRPIVGPCRADAAVIERSSTLDEYARSQKAISGFTISNSGPSSCENFQPITVKSEASREELFWMHGPRVISFWWPAGPAIWIGQCDGPSRVTDNPILIPNPNEERKLRKCIRIFIIGCAGGKAHGVASRAQLGVQRTQELACKLNMVKLCHRRNLRQSRHVKDCPGRKDDEGF